MCVVLPVCVCVCVCVFIFVYLCLFACVVCGFLACMHVEVFISLPLCRKSDKPLSSSTFCVVTELTAALLPLCTAPGELYCSFYVWKVCVFFCVCVNRMDERCTFIYFIFP